MTLTGGAVVDRIVEVDFAANVKADLAMLRPEGQIVVYGSGAGEIAVPFFDSIVKSVAMRFFIVYNLGAHDRQRATALLHVDARARRRCGITSPSGCRWSALRRRTSRSNRDEQWATSC